MLTNHSDFGLDELKSEMYSSFDLSSVISTGLFILDRMPVNACPMLIDILFLLFVFVCSLSLLAQEAVCSGELLSAGAAAQSELSVCLDADGP